VMARHSMTAGWEGSTRGMVDGEEEVAKSEGEKAEDLRERKPRSSSRPPRRGNEEVEIAERGKRRKEEKGSLDTRRCDEPFRYSGRPVISPRPR
jgi:hypothetical protein